MAPAVMVGIMAVGTAISVAGALKEGESNAAAAEYNAQRADENAKLAFQAGRADASREEFRNRLALGSIRAAYGASGVTMDGTPMENMEQQRAIGMENVTAIKYKALLEAKKYQAEADLYRKQAGGAREGATWNAVSKGAAGASQIVSNYTSGGGSRRASTYAARSSASMTRVA